MAVPGFDPLIDAPRDILGKEVILLHWAGATERCTLTTKEEVAESIKRGWTRYRLAS